MAPPPPKRLLTKDDVPGAPEWLDRLIGPLNAFLGPAGAALSHSLTFGENFAGEVRVVELTPPDEWVYIDTFSNGWAQSSDTTRPLVAYRKTAEGYAELQGALQGTTSGTVAFSLPSDVWPDKIQSRPSVSPTANSSHDITTAGDVILYGGTGLHVLPPVYWPCANRSPPRWASPVDVKLGLPQRPFPGRAGPVILLSARQVADPSVPVVVTGMDIESINMEKQKAAPGIRVHRVWGLAPAIKYRLTLLVLPE